MIERVALPWLVPVVYDGVHIYTYLPRTIQRRHFSLPLTIVQADRPNQTRMFVPDLKITAIADNLRN